MFGIADNVVKRLLSNSMEKWRIKLYSSSTMRGEIEIKRGIFQGDSPSPLLFVASMTPLRLLLGKTKYRYYLKGKQVNHLLYMNDLKLYAKSKTGLESW